jgi:hypothetical protein
MPNDIAEQDELSAGSVANTKFLILIDCCACEPRQSIFPAQAGVAPKTGTSRETINHCYTSEDEHPVKHRPSISIYAFKSQKIHVKSRSEQKDAQQDDAASLSS